MRNHSALNDHAVGSWEAPKRGQVFGVSVRKHDPLQAITSMFSANKAANATKDAAQTQADAANRATDLQGSMFQQTQRNLYPYMNTGESAGGRLSALLGIGGNPDSEGYGSLTQKFQANPMDFYKDPGYQFQLEQGQQALQNSQAAKDGVLSGAALKDLIGFNQGMAKTAYNDYFNRYQTGTMNDYNRYMGQNDATYQRLSNLLGIGENAAAGAGNMGVQAGHNMADTLTSGAAAQAAGQIGSANAWTGGINNAMGYYMLNKMGGGSGGSSMFPGAQMGSLSDLFGSNSMFSSGSVI